ncbi:GGDEF domain-containing protein [Paludisphaera borealis]|uniref:diguanylate cyclase n=1 Tax=Paludisphaera borealis TaxID=1387353 RepID=A0A1U7CIK6_9BACT|nr:GGDEF domain-containing protein [Paludisphaera borealis]APW58738.1 putative diguanylate cyclase, distantly related to bacterial beta-galactosidase [Paludisphaera borealis]
MVSLETKRNLGPGVNGDASLLGTPAHDLAEVSARLGSASPPAVLDEIHQLRSKLEEAYATIDELRASRSGMEEDLHQLKRIASMDDLTGLWNRRFLVDSLDISYSFALRHQLSLSIVLFDVDHFKAFNDGYGHPAGDAVLREVASIVLNCARNHDVVARYGGEEFAVLLPGTGRSGAIAMADRVRRSLEERQWNLRPITASFGVATLRHCESEEAATAANLVEAADLAMYHSKRHGRNRVTHAEDVVCAVFMQPCTPESPADRRADAPPDSRLGDL